MNVLTIQPIPRPVETPAILAANPFASVKVDPGTNTPSAMKPPAMTRSTMKFFDLINSLLHSNWLHYYLHPAIDCPSRFRFIIRGKVAAQPLRLHGNRSEEHTSELQSQSNLVC